ncbi:hypothetical protein EAG_08293 [Camponotus floridanus]|uniref:Uncharacterized protein n=1 Tax=Camponotus floridanus TaxID=104421 RepID=E2APJ4_CAMFO|nr:hypothetical protein EAG_08293 [Camponotus floridanus]
MLVGQPDKREFNYGPFRIIRIPSIHKQSFLPYLPRSRAFKSSITETLNFIRDSVEDLLTKRAIVYTIDNSAVTRGFPSSLMLVDEDELTQMKDKEKVEVPIILGVHFIKKILVFGSILLTSILAHLKVCKLQGGQYGGAHHSHPFNFWSTAVESNDYPTAVFQGKSTFLTGFGLGFLAFGLKKLFLPLLFGVQIIKSILLALFLPSIIGSIGNIVGKGVSSFAQSSHNPAVVPEENFEFKDNTDLYNDDYLTRQPVGTLPASAMYDESMMQTQKSPDIASRYAFVDTKISHANALSDRYYTRHVASHGLSKKQDFKIPGPLNDHAFDYRWQVFHEIPTSSLLLTNYDPFYSPLLSRLDAVFFRLGHNTEGCREYAVCAMYRSPARYAPYSNLVSAQLSRELNELRKPSSDNPDVLRFFRYMKAAKDGQDGVKCEEIYAGCANGREDQVPKQNQAMLATYQDINKLVQARKI